MNYGIFGDPRLVAKAIADEVDAECFKSILGELRNIDATRSEEDDPFAIKRHKATGGTIKIKNPVPYAKKNK